ncbi:HelD family protein [Pseudalkalibacillus hwajinpoensis]|uniref:DNA helicase UvrD n=1 Tax=Guptibacillus hwajinpoensis TaxID=208199 RepID=A0A4U1MD82_9BACL|nr:3'-5' exonuclease [Pseudalkalibacillus hwajinpoensis]TKD68295.1 DNA helicase UvrD [Pseudalkalibacillus hwajinpoensis]
MDQKNQSAYQKEKQQLEKIAAEITKQQKKLANYPRYSGDNVTEQVLESIREENRTSLAIAAKEPYFARMDFQEDEKESRSYYIGKVGVAHEDSQDSLVVDWRAPVASMFYAFTGGEEEVYYISPDGMIEGNIELKRNIVIRNQELQRVVDTYVEGSEELSGSDEFLLYRLSENKDNRLRDIVSTIQAKQNDIIRAERTKPLIIQGAAGSGKTTVALHRLAYLLYEYRDTIQAGRMVIFAPNRMFLDYISGVLPELGVGGIQQSTFTDWTLSMIEEKVKLDSSGDDLQKWFGKKRPEIEKAEGRIKGSLAFKEWIDSAIKAYSAVVGPKGSFTPFEGRTLSEAKIQQWLSDLASYPVGRRREMMVNRFRVWIKNEIKTVDGSHIQKEYRKLANEKLKEYFKTWPKQTALSFYKALFQTNAPSYVSVLERDQMLNNLLMKETASRLKKKQLTPDDLAPFLYIQFKLNGISKDDVFQHIVIDEAQDFSPFQLALLIEVNRSRSFTILGDLAQGIHAYKGIHNWEEFRELFNGKELYIELEQSYRSTLEIIEFANEVISHANIPVQPAVPVFRSGESVLQQKVNKEEHVNVLLATANEMSKRGMNTIAIVGRSEEECHALFDEVSKQDKEANLITAHDRSYAGGLSIVPIYLTKGLEFDGVIIADASKEHYCKDAEDAKLLYVGCTRALHELKIFYIGDPSQLLLG